jgi:glutamine synthetase
MSGSHHTKKPVFALPEGTHTVAFGFGDLNGIMRGKRIPAQHWTSACEHGIGIITAMFAMDMTCDIWETPYCSMDNGYPDMHMFPIAAPVACPWEPGVAICLAYTETMDHTPVPIDPRNALVRQVERAQAMGFDSFVGTELEFYLLDPVTKLPKQSEIDVYGINRSAELDHVLGPIRNHLTAIGIPIEQSNPEYAPGQVEVNIRYGRALDGADRVILFRNMIKDIARREGYHATFMAKPFIDKSGSGFHTHYSLWKDGKNAFAKDGKLNELGYAFLAGMQSRMAEMSLAGSTTPNAYRRRRPGAFCPVNTAWGYDNRTVALRILEGNDGAVRIEKRDGAADCNPYYHLACELAAGLDGIEAGLKPKGSATLGDACKLTDADPIPTTIDQAIELARRSDFLRQVMGEDGLAILVQQAERERDFVAAQITAVETSRYVGNL